jgi:ectoine hydroxylase-related dioxygenase (phytanoyl-CoA dioxygenase family)
VFTGHEVLAAANMATAIIAEKNKVHIIIKFFKINNFVNSTAWHCHTPLVMRQQRQICHHHEKKYRFRVF